MERTNVLKSVPHPKEFFGGAGIQRSIGDLCLLGQILSALYRRHHPLHSQEGSQVGSVGWDDDEGEEPPDASDDAARQRAKKKQDRMFAWSKEAELDSSRNNFMLTEALGKINGTIPFLPGQFCRQSRTAIYKPCDVCTIQMTYIASHSPCTHTLFSFHHAWRA